MKIDLTQLLRKVGNEAAFEESEKTSYPEDNLNLTKPVSINIHLVNTGTSVLVKGKIETEAELECSRCLKAFNLPLSVEIEEEFSKKGPEHRRAEEVELKGEDFVYPIEKDNSINLSEVIRQNLLLAMPMKTLCQLNCNGIQK
jgi:uncharacterized protein